MRLGSTKTMLVLGCLLSADPSAQSAKRAVSPETQGKEYTYAWGDFDSDGLLDAYVLLSAGSDLLLHNEGQGVFLDVTDQSGLSGSAPSSLMEWVDLDQDGRLDFVSLTRTGMTRIFIGDGKGGFARGDSFLPGDIPFVARSFELVNLDADPGMEILVKGIDASEAVLIIKTNDSFVVSPFHLEDSILARSKSVPRPPAVFAPGGPLEGEGPKGAESEKNGNDRTKWSRGILPLPEDLREGYPASAVPPESVSQESQPVPFCAEALKDQANGSCLQASSVGALGMLFPLSLAFFVDTVANRVGIGTTSPDRALHVDGGMRADSVAVWPDTATGLFISRDDTPGAARFLFNVSGSGYNGFPVQLGRDGGSTPVVIPGQVDIGGRLSVDGEVDAGAFTSFDFRQAADDKSVTIAGGTNSNLGGNITVWGPGHPQYPDQIRLRQSGTEIIRVKDGKVGIATTNPQSTLDVSGVVKAKGGVVITETAPATPELQFNNGTQTWRIGNPSSGTNNFQIQDGTLGSALVIEPGSVGALRIDSAARVGVGTAAPATKLDVNGTVRSRSGGFQFPDGTVQATAATASGGGNGGFGTTNPQTLLHVEGSAPGAPNWPGIVLLRQTGTIDHALVMESTQDSVGVATEWRPSGGEAWQVAASSIDDGRDFIVRRKLNNQWLDILTLEDQTGNVGIGTSNPQNKLHVEGKILANKLEALVSADIAKADVSGDLDVGGNANVIGSISVGAGATVGGSLLVSSDAMVAGRATVEVLEITGGADFAELFSAVGQEEPQPGMVVVASLDTPGGVEICSKAYDRKVVGIVSGANGVQAGLTLRQRDTLADGEVLVAMTGRVWCWCDAEAGGPIAVGDMLAASATTGHGMRVKDPRDSFGCTIGKALTSLPKGRGLVLVLVGLQ